MKKKFIIKKYREYLDIISYKNYKKNHLFTIYFKEKKEAYSRIGILISKKNGNAVRRNKIKRQIRTYLKDFDFYKRNLDLIIIISKNYQDSDYSYNEKALHNLLIKIEN